MNTKRFHRILGLILLLPLLGWALTGLVFLIKPGYAGAYAMLAPKTYTMTTARSFTPDPAWREFRCMRTLLGDHLIATTDAGALNLNPATLQPVPEPKRDDIQRLLSDACSIDPLRYGHVFDVGKGIAHTDTGVELTWDWNSMSLSQRGRDTTCIDWLYRIHYLQWTGIPAIDRPLSVIGIVLLLALTALGVKLAFMSRP